MTIITSEVLSDWSAPEINFELNNETINMRVRSEKGDGYRSLFSSVGRRSGLGADATPRRAYADAKPRM